jgi:hypothetical protein
MQRKMYVTILIRLFMISASPDIIITRKKNLLFLILSNDFYRDLIAPLAIPSHYYVTIRKSLIYKL